MGGRGVNDGLPQYASAAVRAVHGARGLLQYGADARHGPNGVTGELLAAATALFSAGTRARWCAPQVSPFVCPAVIAAARQRPLGARYSPLLATRYQRLKAAVVELIPRWARVLLPPHKQYFTNALDAATAHPVSAPHATAAGLLDPEAVSQCTDTATRMTVAAVERWLAGAQASGYRIPGVSAHPSEPDLR